MEKDINNLDKEIELSVIVPCYNEENNVQELTDRIRIVFLDKGISGEIILVDDKSTDNTKKKIIELAGKYPDGVQGVFHDKNYGMETGWISGLARVRGNLVCIIDADLQYLPEDIYRLYREYHYTGVDYVQGYRSTIGREKGNRYYFSVGLNVLLNFTFGMKARDNKSGFILTSKQIFNNILFHRFDYSYFQSFISVSAHSKGYSMSEVEVIFDKRRTGDSFLNNFPLSTILKTFNDIAKAFFEFRFSSKKDIFLDEYIDSYQNKIEDKSPKFSPARRLYLKFYALLMPLHHWMIGATAIHYFWLLRKTQWLKPEQVLDLQYKRLTMLLEHAYRHVPYYRDVFNSLNLT